jgi:hypothetical protein
MAGWMQCPECGKGIRYGLPEEKICSSCGWSAARELRRRLQETCTELGENYFKLLEEFGDDETIHNFLIADDPEEYRSLFREFGGDAEAVDAYTWAMAKDD